MISEVQYNLTSCVGFFVVFFVGSVHVVFNSLGYINTTSSYYITQQTIQKFGLMLWAILALKSTLTLLYIEHK